MRKAILAAVAVVGLVATAGTAAAQPYKVWYKSSDPRWDARTGQWIRYNSLDDEGVNPNNRAWYEAAAQRLTRTYQSQGYNVVFAVGGVNTPPGGGPAKPPAATTYYFVDVEFLYRGQRSTGALGPFRSAADAEQFFKQWAAAVTTQHGTVLSARLRTVRK